MTLSVQMCKNVHEEVLPLATPQHGGGLINFFCVADGMARP